MNDHESEGITVHFPFKWLRPHEPTDAIFKFESDRPERFRYVCDEEGEAYIEISNIQNWAYAEQMVYRCWFGLLCYSALKHSPHQVEAATAEIDWLDDIRRQFLGQMLKEDLTDVDGIVMGRMPYIYGGSSRVKRTRFGVTLKVTREDGDSIAEELVESCLDERFYELAADKKLIGALEMANLANSEAPKLARFVLIVAALEALMPEGELSQSALEQISSWELEAQKLGIEELTDLRALKHPSIAKRFRKLASSFPPISATTNKLKKSYMQDIVVAYDCRSALVHTGSCDAEEMGRVYPTVYFLLQRVLTDRLRWTVKSNSKTDS